MERTHIFLMSKYKYLIHVKKNIAESENKKKTKNFLKYATIYFNPA